MYLITLFLSTFIWQCSVCSNILFIDGVPSPSHQIYNYAIAEALLARGHNVTLLGPLTIKPLQHKNLHQLVIEGSHEEDFNFEELMSLSPTQMQYQFYEYSVEACKAALNSTGSKSLMNYPDNFKFDLIIFDNTLGSCQLPLILKFKYPPTIAVTAFLLPPYLSFDFGNDLQPAYLPCYHLTYSSEMSFFERLTNYYMLYRDMYLRKTYFNPMIEDLHRKAFGDNVVSDSELAKHISLLLSNWSPVLHHPQPVTPNIIPIGGSHIKSKKLPKDLQDMLDTAKNGVIFFSLGSNLKSSMLTPSKKEILINTFSKLKETVLWKFEANVTGLPKNVITRKWLPQADLLAHPNLKLFISHGGGLSTIEASYFGVPILGIPFSFDQPLNVENLVRKEAALKVDYRTLTTEKFLRSIKEMLNNEKYSRNMKEISRRLQDQPETPLERAVFWIEYAIRHNGTHFLNPKSRSLPRFVTSCADIHLFFLSVVLMTLFILKKIYNLLFKRTKKSNNKSKSD